MKRITALVFLLAMSACAAVSGLFHRSPPVVFSVPVAAHTVVTYGSRPFEDYVLTLNSDNTYALYTKSDSIVAEKGSYSVAGDSLVVADGCVLQLSSLWLKGSCFSESSLWRETPSTPTWPPSKTVPPVAFLPTTHQTLDKLLL